LKTGLNRNESDGGGGMPKAEEAPLEISAFQLDDDGEPLKQVTTTTTTVTTTTEVEEEKKSDSVQR